MAQKPHKTPKPVVLCILDGWGHAAPSPSNAIAAARTPVYDRWWKDSPVAFLKTAGQAVGLPDGQMGNSEVGHMNIGGGRIVKQDLPRIDEAIAAGELEKNPVLMDLMAALKKTGGALHIMGLMSPGGVHSHQDHMKRIAEIAAGNGIPVKVHAFLDGRDTPPKSAVEYVEAFEKNLEDKDIEIATVSGRYYAMDRDRRWDRVEKAYRAIAEGAGEKASSAVAAIEAAYVKDETDEFVTPAVIRGYEGLRDGDALLMANFRADRAREIVTALSDPDFAEFPRKKTINHAYLAGMVEYSEELNALLTPLFTPIEVADSLGEVAAKAGLKQLRLAETEKYAHVTFFFNGGQETTFPGEERILVPSPKVATYDLKPEMSAPEVTEKLVDAIASGGFDLIVVNYANPDMVGHTGKLAAAVKAVEVIDECLGKVEDALKKAGGVMLLSADHGNIEKMDDPENAGPHTAHTTYDVPVVLVNGEALGNAPLKLKNGILADLAPTVLALLGLEKPAAMTGETLLSQAAADPAAGGKTRHAVS